MCVSHPGVSDRCADVPHETGVNPADREPDAAASPGDGSDLAAQHPASARSRWPWVVVALVLLGCIVVGLVFGASVGLRGGSLFPAQAASGAARPTIVVIARATPASPSPVARSTPAPGEPTPAPAVAAEYVVEDGDTMRGVAEKVYGDANLWPRIYDANRDLIGPNPDALQVGMHLHIPPAS
jgi:cell division septation protein DedD